MDYGTTNAIDVNDLRALFTDFTESSVDALLDGEDMSTLALFVCKYAVHASTIKDDLKKRLRMEQQKSSDAGEESNLWTCAADFLTNSDLAFAAWQYFNSANDWKDKRESQDGKLRYVCNTLWTSDKSSWRYERGGTDEASAMYDNLVTFFQTLKAHQNYEVFRVVCNDVAKKVGLVPDLTNDAVPSINTKSRRRREAENNLPALIFQEFEFVPGMTGYVAGV